MTEVRNSFENVSSMDVDFKRVETKFDQSESKSLFYKKTL